MAVGTLVLGIGNPSRCDDAAGVRVARNLRERGAPPGCVVEEHARGWLDAVDRMIGFERVILVDAIRGGEAPGSLVEITIEDLEIEASGAPAMAHAIGLADAVAMAREQDRDVPEEIRILGIRVVDVDTFSETCTPEVERAIELACDVVVRWCSEPRASCGG